MVETMGPPTGAPLAPGAALVAELPTDALQVLEWH
jgi:hypothetical protein